jgi:hypothetical protein
MPAELEVTEFDLSPSRERDDVETPAAIVATHTTNPPVPVSLDTRGVTRQAKQRTFEFSRQLVREQLVARLLTSSRPDFAAKLAECHSRKTVKRCTNCNTISTFYNRCDLNYCPSCQPRLSRERAESIEWWTKLIKQPKHVVLTARNSATLTKNALQGYKSALKKLLRRSLAREWAGGCYSLEITNEGRGWHVHFHLLVDARWIDQAQLAKVWGALVGQDFAIVHVTDCRGQDYLREVTKYAVKGTDLAKWPPEEIVTYIAATRGVRTFGTFGTLFKRNAEFREWLQDLQHKDIACPCGCTKFQFISEEEWEWHEATSSLGAPPVRTPAPVPDAQLAFI